MKFGAVTPMLRMFDILACKRKFGSEAVLPIDLDDRAGMVHVVAFGEEIVTIPVEGRSGLEEHAESVALVPERLETEP